MAKRTSPGQIRIDRFAAGAAGIFRQSGGAAAIALADRLDGIAGEVIGAGTDRRPMVASHLETALEAADAHSLLQTLGGNSANLDWQEVEWDVGMPAGFIGRYAFVELIGPDGMLPHAGFRLGLYLQPPMTLYPKHWHAAEEYYFLLSGTAEWRQGGRPTTVRRSGDFVHHGSGEPHAMRTGAMPLLALWAWVGDLDNASYRIDPGDWH